MMENVYKFPKDDYALALLSQAAMHAPDSNSFDHSGPNTIPRESRDQPLWITNHSDEDLNIHHDRRSISSFRGPPSFKDFNPPAISSRTMDTLSLSTQASRSDLYMNQGYQGMTSGHYSGNLGILNAEQYDDGRSTMRSQDTSHLRLKQQPEVAMPFGLKRGSDQMPTNEENEGGNGNRRKKRPRADTTSADDEDWASKKARGRPRVDTKDENAADRRRTQIRMAQRAYRHRKETTISSLEKQVQELKGTNEQMSNTFISLYDFAINKGLLQREPEFGQQLQSTIERILALAKSTSSEDGHKDEEPQTEEGAKQIHNETELEPEQWTINHRASPKEQQLEPPQIEDVSANSWGGYQLSKEDSPSEDMQLVYPQQPQEQRTRNGDYQIISRATEENASFPFEFMDLQQYRVEVPPMEDYSQNFFSQTVLPLPDSHAYNEFSFARRIQRAALEKAYRLITANPPNPERFQKVFGFCLLFESKEEIEARVKKCLASSTKETLQVWRAPFVHIGGSGTFYPMHDTDGEPMPKFRTGFSMGPQSPAATAVQEKIQDDFRCTLPGFEGEFFDANDVEGYLRGRGLEIPATADFVTVQLDRLALFDMAGPLSYTAESIATMASPRTPTSPVGTIQGLLVDSVEQDPYNLDFAKAEANIVASNENLAKPACHLPFPLGFTNWDTDFASAENNGNTDQLFSTMPNKDRGTASDGVATASSPYNNTRTVTINVNTLVQELLGKIVCLGRSPGFRPADVNAAILAAVRAGF